MEEAGQPMSGSSLNYSSSSLTSPMSQQQPKSTVFEKLALLCEEMEADIKENAQAVAMHPQSQQALQATIGKAKERAYLDRSPEAQLAVSLYQMYKDAVKKRLAAASISSSSSASSLASSSSFFSEEEAVYTAPLTSMMSKYTPTLPHYVLEAQDEIISGHKAAVTKNIFYLRLACWFLSLVSFSVMSTAPFIHYAAPTPKIMFLPSCQGTNSLSGSFNFQPFQAAIASGVLIFIHSSLFLIYYVLPTDANGHKHVPYIELLFEPCMVDNSDVHGYSSRIATFCKIRSKSIEVCGDAFLLFFNGLITIICAALIEQGSRFDSGKGGITFYTIGTFFDSFLQSSPACVAAPSPAPYIRASLAMLFITLFTQALTLIVSVKSYLKEAHVRRSGVPLSSAHDGGAKSSLIANADPDNDNDDVVEVSL